MECSKNLFSGVHVWREPAFILGEVCRFCGARKADVPVALPKPKRFDGATILEQPDAPERLSGLWERVHAYVMEHPSVELWELAEATGGSEASVSARLRDLRKERFGRHEVERSYQGSGVYRYTVQRSLACPECVRLGSLT